MIEPDDLTDEQRAVYESDERRMLVLGGPGSGKTTVALLKSRRVLERAPEGSDPRVLFLTFSRAATSELTRRMPTAVGGPLGARIEVSTFHAFALAMVNAFSRFAGGPTRQIAVCSREQQELGVQPAGSLTFDAIVPAAIDLLNHAPWLLWRYRERFTAVFCDEFQDTHAAQWELLRMLVPDDWQLVCLADPNQVIFDFSDDTIPGRIQDYLDLGATAHNLGYASHRDPSNVIPRAAGAIRRREFGSPDIVEACDGGRLRVLRYAGDDPSALLVEEIRGTLRSGARDLGVFFARNATVNDFARRLQDEGIDHEIVGTGTASAEAQVAVAAAARHVAGEADWAEFRVALGVFVAASVRGTPPDLAIGLARDPRLLHPGVIPALERERERLVGAGQASVEDFLRLAHDLWDRVFLGWQQRPWGAGVRGLMGLTLELRRRPVERPVARAITQIAQERRDGGLLDAASARPRPVRLMNVYQVKGREMDQVFLVHLAGDPDARDAVEAERLGRVHYVSMSRARQRATIVLPPNPRQFFAPYAGLGRR